MKEKVIQKIRNIEDPELLTHLDQWINEETENKPVFSQNELKELREGYKQYEAGKHSPGRKLVSSLWHG